MKEKNIEHCKSKFFDSFVGSGSNHLNEAFKFAALKGHFEIVKYLFEKSNQQQEMLAVDD